MKAKYDVDDGHVPLDKCDDDGDWVYYFVYSYHICRDNNLFMRVMGYEHESVTLPSREEFVIKAIWRGIFEDAQWFSKAA